MSAEPGAASGPDSEDPIGARYPNTARIWNYQLGGKDNFAVDRKASEAANAMVRSLGVPDGANTAIESRHLLQRMVDYMVGQGVRQFLDLGSGLPNMANTHQIAHRTAPDARILQMNSRSADITSWLEPVFALVRQEADSNAPGAQAIFAKLADVFLSQALRTYLVGAEQAGLLAPRQVADSQLGPALAALHDQPAANWTLAELADLASMSRTMFAARFRDAVGESPMRHLAKIRLGQAAGYLTTTGLSVEAIARRTGYGTNASLSKAFKREFGTSPGQYRETKGDAAVLPAGGTEAELGAPDPGN